MFNLYNDTQKESGIIIYNGGSVAVCTWLTCDNNSIPRFSPLGLPFYRPVDVDDKIVHVNSVDDVRGYLPGTVYIEYDEICSDMDIVYDEYYDIPALFGFGPNAGLYTDAGEHPYSGDIWRLPSGETVITIDLWGSV